MRVFFVIVIMILGLLPEGVEAQNNHFEYLTAKDGLALNTIRGVVKDKYGFMWFGTWNGLCRYDGYTFKVYKNIPGDTTSIANSRIHHIFKDKDGVLWITTFNYFICRYNYQTDDFTRYSFSSISKEMKDSTSRQKNLPEVYAIADELKSVVGPFELSSSKESVIFQVTPNNTGGLNDRNVNYVYKDNCNILWFGTSTGGINKLDLKAPAFHEFSITNGADKFTNSAVRAMIVNGDEVWAGTQDDGLVCVNTRTGDRQNLSLGPAGKNARAVCKDSYGDIWVGYRDGLDRYSASARAVTHYFGKTDNENFEYRFSSIAEDPVDSSVWLGTFRSMLRYDRKAKDFKKQELPILNNSNTVSLFFDSKKNLWIGTEYEGLIEIKRNAATNRWTDTIVYAGEGEKAIKAPLPDERVYSITEDESGLIWAGTANGLCCIDPATRKVKVYSKQEGLADQYISKVLSDKKGNIWFSHKKGLSKLNIKTGVVRNYIIKDNFKGYEFMDGAGYRDEASGTMYFGGSNGFITFQPAEITDNPYLPIIVFTELQVLNKPVAVGQKVNDRVILSTPLYLTRQITFTHEDRSFAIEFAGLHYSSPWRNQYAYMLEGQDKDWIHTDASRRIANYANLPAGKYVFKVKASNSDGVWNPDPAVLEIVILPPWWRTWWAYTGYFLILLFLIYWAWKLVKARQQYLRQILAERLKAEKAREIDELKSRFFTNVSHEFRTPLTLIIDPLETLMAQNTASEKEKGYYGMMYRNARRLLGLINQFLDFRKLESGGMQLHVQNQDLVAFLRNTLAAFEFQAAQHQIRFVFEAEQDAMPFGFDEDVVSKILYNLVSNAFKFTPNGGSIVVSLKMLPDNPQRASLSVTDNGAGIPAPLLDKIFEPFYQVDATRNQNKNGTGVGLSFTKQLAVLHKGDISVTSEPGVATCFTVTFSSLLPNMPAAFVKEADVVEKELTQKELLPVEDAATNTDTPEVADGITILVTEDNDDIRNYLQSLLSDTYKVVTASNGNEGLAKALEIIPDLVISDIMMPGISGLDLCRQLKTEEKTSHIPVILLTARQSEQYQTEGYETGADDYIGKPFSSALLLVRIKNLLDSRKKLRQLFGQSTGFDTNIVATNAVDKVFLSKAAQLIENHMADVEFSVEWLATQLFVSRTQLYRKIKALTDQSVNEFITVICLNKAAELLLQGQYSVSEVAMMVGYADSTSFGRAFQKQFAQTPKKYSQQNSGG